MNRYRLADNIVTALETKHMPQKELAQILGVHANTVYRWCRGLQIPASWDLYRTAKLLGTTMDELMEGVDDD